MAETMTEEEVRHWLNYYKRSRILGFKDKDLDAARKGEAFLIVDLPPDCAVIEISDQFGGFSYKIRSESFRMLAPMEAIPVHYYGVRYYETDEIDPRELDNAVEVLELRHDGFTLKYWDDTERSFTCSH